MEINLWLGYTAISLTHPVRRSCEMVFRLFRKNRKPSSLMDYYIKVVYGNNRPPSGRADVSIAVKLAEELLLGGVVDAHEIRTVAIPLYQGPIPYSTHELALAAALSIFAKADIERRSQLAEVQLFSRMTMLQWLTEGKIAPVFAETFEDALYKQFKQHVTPSNAE